MTKEIALSLLAAVTLCVVTSPIPAQQAGIAPPSGKASIVIFRSAKEPLLSAHNVDYPIAFDEQWISKLPKGRYFVFPAWPGRHRIAPAVRSEQIAAHTASEWDSPGAMHLDLDVKAGETYYIKANPGAFRFGSVDTMERVGRVAFELLSGETAQESLAASAPVDWLKDLQEGTLAEVRTVEAQAATAAFECGNVEWTPDIDSTQTSTFKRMSTLHGSVSLREGSLMLQLRSADAVGITIQYADIASAEIKNKGLKRAVVIRRKNGHLDSLSVLTSGGGRVDRERTKICGEQLAEKLGT